LLDIALTDDAETVLQLVRNNEDVVFPSDVVTDSYTKLCSHFDGADEATAYTDPVQGAATFAGTAQLDTAQKKFGTASLLLDGDSDYVTIPDSEDWNFGSGDFTIDFWVRFASLTGSPYQALFSKSNGTGYSPILLFFTGGASGTLHLAVSINGTSWAIDNNGSKSDFAVDTWYHISLIRSGDVYTLRVDGISDLVVTQAGTLTITTAPFNIGSNLSTIPFNGWIDEFRISKGIARWTADFTPPTAAYGHLYTAFPFEFDPPKTTSKGEIPTYTLRVGNITRLLQPYLQTLSGGNGSVVDITIVNSELLAENYSELKITCDILACQSTAEWVTFTLGAPNPLRRRYPLERYLALHCRWHFKSCECGYTGAETTCKRTLADCRLRSNSVRFGGFTGMRSGSVRIA